MSIPCRRILVALMSVLCAAALLFPTWAAYAVEAPTKATSENDALFYEYLLQCAGASNHADLLSDAGSKLNTKDRELYDHLKAFVAKIASGEETEAVYTITYDDFQRTWTAAELGVSNILSPEVDDALLAKVQECGNYNTKAVMNALLADCPYELYWYNKSRDDSAQFSFYCRMVYTKSSTEVTITSPAPTFTVTMSVSPDYGSGTTVNRALHAGIESTVTNAKAIVDKYQGKSDYEKLLGYSTEICNLVTYDTAAAENKNTPYGDPWQLISVLDGNPDTNVVCEGYSKAFKYLCDLSTFNNSKVECCLVTGLLGGGTGAGNHMWNVVTMDNGKRYLVDVTNSDSNGGPEYLLLKGGTPNSQQSTQYDFYDWLSFVYDEETRNLWGDEFLTLDTVDYKDAASNPGGEEPNPGTPPAYAYEIQGLTSRGENLTVQLQNNFGDGALLIVAAYAESGQFLRVAADSTQTANIAQGKSGNVTLPLHTGDEKIVRVILLDNDTLKPLCESEAYRFQ